jgi:hypothetical protein
MQLVGVGQTNEEENVYKISCLYDILFLSSPKLSMVGIVMPLVWWYGRLGQRVLEVTVGFYDRSVTLDELV